MELGLDFEDGDFEDKEKNKNRQPLTSYNAKVCYPCWYKDAETSDPETASTVYKFRGDNCFFNQKYQEAISYYRTGLDNLPESNRCMRQDLTESLARSYMYTNNTLEAMQLAKNLVEGATNIDMRMQALMLLQQIQHQCQDHSGELNSLKQLIDLHPFNVQYWLKLVECYQIMYKELYPLDCNSEEFVKVFTCFIRARLLLRSVRFSVGSFIKEKYQVLLDKVDKEIKELNASEDTQHRAKQFIGEDIFTLDSNKDNEDCLVSIITSEDRRDFDDRWFRWNQHSCTASLDDKTLTSSDET